MSGEKALEGTAPGGSDGRAFSLTGADPFCAGFVLLLLFLRRRAIKLS